MPGNSASARDQEKTSLVWRIALPDAGVATRNKVGEKNDYHQRDHPKTGCEPWLAAPEDDRWVKLARDNQARIQVPTLRNVDKRPDRSFVKAYTHNGYFTSLKAIVHYYNTRDVLPRCKPNDPGEGTTCWPAPESTDNMNSKFMGRLGLSDAEEDALVAFMQTLTDGFMPR